MRLSLLSFLLLPLAIVVAKETHCRDAGDCPLYPLHSCFATSSGLLCKDSRQYEGFEASINPIETFNYKPYINHNDTGEPCHTIPRSADLDAFVNLRGIQAIRSGDLDLIGNCSRFTYCDKSTNTCQPRRSMGATCQHNTECSVGDDYYPGHCNTNTSRCGIRSDIPAFYYGRALPRWKLGDHWQEAVAAVLVTGIVAICFLVGRHQAGKLVSGVSGLIEKWQNRDDHDCVYQQQLYEQRLQTTISDEEIWSQQHARRAWWHVLPGAQRIGRLLQLQKSHNDNGTYVPLDSRPVDPPPYRGD